MADETVQLLAEPGSVYRIGRQRTQHSWSGHVVGDEASGYGVEVRTRCGVVLTGNEDAQILTGFVTCEACERTSSPGGVNYVAQNGAGRDCCCGCDPWPSGSCGERAPVAVPPTCPTCGGSGVTQETHDGGTHPVHCPCTYLTSSPGQGNGGEG